MNVQTALQTITDGMQNVITSMFKWNVITDTTYAIGTYLLLSPVVYAFICIVTLFMTPKNRFQSFLKLVNTCIVALHIIFLQAMLNRILSKEHLILNIEQESIPNIGYPIIDNILNRMQIIDINLILNTCFYLTALMFLLRCIDLFFRKPKQSNG